MRYVESVFRAWRIVHDASGKVLIRRFVKGDEVLFATAQWRNGSTTDRRSQRPNVPSDKSWREVEEHIRTALEDAANSPPNPKLDPAELPAKAEGEGEKVEPMSNFGLFVLGIIAVGLAIGLYFAWPYIKVVLDLVPHGDENGKACKYNSDCRSGVCDFGSCKAAKRSRGDRCDFDSQCSSGDCTKALCN